MTKRPAFLLGTDWIPIGLVLAVLASRLPFASRMLFSFDSANYALALRDYYNVAHHQPHPPGYPLYVAIAKLVDLVVQEPNDSLVLVSISAAAVAVVFTYWLGREWFGPAVGVSAALLLLTAAGFWGYSEVAYPYTCLAAASAVGAFAAWRIGKGAPRLATWSGVLMGVIAGVRWDSLAFLAPIWGLSMVRAPKRSVLLASLGLLVTVMAWAIPMVQLSGGLTTYLAALRAQSSVIIGNYSLLGDSGDLLVRLNLQTLVEYLREAFGLGLLVLVVATGRMFGPGRLISDARARFLLVWIIPPLAVYLLVHIGDPGYVLSLAPAISILTAWTLFDLGEDLGLAAAGMAARTGRGAAVWSGVSRSAPLLPVLGAVVLCVWEANVFLRAPGPARLPEIRQIDATLRSQVDYVKAHLDASATVILAHDRYRQAQYYLRGYDVRLLFDEYRPDYRGERTRLPVAGALETVVVLDEDQLAASGPPQGERIVVHSNPEVRLWQFDVRGLRAVEYGYRRVQLLP